jgi:hypothetical protein
MILNQQAPAATPVLTERQYHIDWLKVFAISLLIPYHAAMLYGPAPFHVKNNDTHPAFLIFNELVGMWYAPLLFFLSGIGSWYALSYRSGGQYLMERVKRLFLPLVFGILVIVPPQTYFERVQKGQFSGSFLEFYPHVFNGIYPVGNLTWNHLWFITYLFFFSLVMLPVFLRLKKTYNRPGSVALAAFLSRKQNIFLLAVPVMLIEFLLRVDFPFGNQNLLADWANFLHFTLVFLYGFWIISQPSLYQSIARNRLLGLALGVAGVLLFYGLRFTGLEPQRGDTLAYRLLTAWQGLNAWCWVIALSGYAHVYLNKPSRWLSYFSKAFLPVYILHQTFVVAFGYYLVPLQAGVVTKYLLLVVAAYVATVGFYELFIKNIAPMRALFGLAAAKQTKRTP